MADIKNLEKIFDFLHLIGKLKTTYRFGANENFQGDSSADHSWRLALMTFIVADELKLKVDLVKSMKIALIHDLAESITGDIDARLIKEGVYSSKEKQDGEVEAMKKIYDTLPEKIGREIYELWLEYENSETPEAKFIKALDKIETLTHIVELSYEKYDDTDLIGTYGNAQVKNFPELADFFRLVKKEIKKEFERGEIPWKEEFDV